MYLQELNRFFREYRIPLTFIPRTVGNGACKAVIGHYRSIRKYLRYEEIIIWVDFDIYTHSEANNYAAKPASVPDFLFSEMNFEDFLALHFEVELFNRWKAVVDARGHFSVPLHSEDYDECWQPIWADFIRAQAFPIWFSDTLHKIYPVEFP